jgi:membrane dipeptidase
MPLRFVDHRADPGAWARALGVSREAIELYLGSEVIDLHVDTFLWRRMFRYDLAGRHGRGLLGASFYGQADLPRLREAQVGGATWVITTNPARTARGRGEALVRNFELLRGALLEAGDDVAVVRDVAEYRAARAAGKHAAFIGIQGANAVGDDPAVLDRLPDRAILRATIVHLTRSNIGAPSAPLGGGQAAPLSPFGREVVRALDARRVFVDLAHINRRGFFDALEAHDRSLPVFVTHTGVAGVTPHWRNIDDEQLRAVADTGGTVGIMYHAPFLGDWLWGGRVASIVDHLEHAVRVIGDDHVSLGSDWDGAIVTPRDMPTCLELPRIVEEMLRRGWGAGRIQNILGGSFLRAVALMRG